MRQVHGLSNGAYKPISAALRQGPGPAVSGADNLHEVGKLYVQCVTITGKLKCRSRDKYRPTNFVFFKGIQQTSLSSLSGAWQLATEPFWLQHQDRNSLSAALGMDNTKKLFLIVFMLSIMLKLLMRRN